MAAVDDPIAHRERRRQEPIAVTRALPVLAERIRQLVENRGAELRDIGAGHSSSFRFRSKSSANAGCVDVPVIVNGTIVTDFFFIKAPSAMNPGGK